MAGICSKASIVAVAALVLTANASGAAPSVAAMNLQAADVPGAKTVSQRSVKEKGFIAAYDKNFAFSTPNGSAGLVALESETLLALSSSVAASNLAALEKGFRSKVGRKVFVAAVAKEAKVEPAAVKLGALRKVADYDQGFDLPISVRVKGGSVYENLVYLRLDRVAVFMLEIGVRPIGVAVTAKYTATIAGHIATELAPAVVTPPSVTGTAQQGQTLTASPGTWTAADATVSYQWQRCDAVGANCAAVPGATALTYAVTTVDVGATLRVAVTATNRFGSANASSSQTAVVI